MNRTTPVPLSRWYCQSRPQSSPGDYDARHAFEEAVQVFKNKGTKDPRKSTALDNIQAATIHDVVAAVNAASEAYKSRRASPSARNCLVEVSKRIAYYGKVMDALVQQHPEYVSLAWGTMKLVFGALVENEKLGTTIVTGLCEVADALPRSELALELYPTDAMRESVVALYTSILRFLTRALLWCEEGRVRHAIHAVTKPAALQYDDILAQIRQVNRSISDCATASSQAEQRDMHNKLRDVETTANYEFSEIRSRQKETQSTLGLFEDNTSSALTRMENHQLQVNTDLVAMTVLIHDLRDTLLARDAAYATERAQITNALSDIQLSQALGAMSSSLALDHMATLRQIGKLLGRRPGKSSRNAMKLQTYATFNDWSTSPSTNILCVGSTFKERKALQQGVVQIIEYLRQSKVAVLWALRSRNQTYETLEVLKSLVYQALAATPSTDTDTTSSSMSRRLFNACFEEDYVHLLDDILQNFNIVYIIVESSVMSSDASTRFQKHCGDLLARSESRAPRGRLKVLVVNYGPSVPPPPGAKDVLKLGKSNQGRAQQARGKVSPAFRGRLSCRSSAAE
ncbi:hypothetical protein EDD37DRAFT_356873 [Exophiala viscosa]|uniref:DUF7708 domain-containing protein n=1 Tax=Exophiala viscosa TaxID=2486360 RepID=A0AAN6IB81_9EURO|nr:hypothetical protein EDD36DRAFT_309414 [Exophiala viscosa]KAI1624735.1 hypothetical protein EDD37DRAFT_356873 [Exophiala viscosa]